MATNRGSGSIETLPSGLYRARVYLGTDGAGKAIRKSKSFKRLRDANTWKAEQLRLHRDGRLADPGKLTLGAWLDQWLAARKAEIEPESYEAQETRVRRHLKPDHGDLRLSALRPATIQHILGKLVERDLSAAMRRKVMSTLRQALREAVRLGHLASDPTVGMKLPTAPRVEFTCWTAEQCRTFLDSTREDPWHALYAIALDSGMRKGELLGLHWSEVDLVAGVVEVRRTLEQARGRRRLKSPKTKAGRRRIALAPSTVAALAAHRRRQEAAGLDVDSGPVFTAPEGGFVRADNFRKRQFNKAIKRAGVPKIRFHDLRHTSATLLLLAGVNIKAVSVRLGHASIQITLDTYSHYMPEMDARISAAVEGVLYASRPTGSPQETGAGAQG